MIIFVDQSAFFELNNIQPSLLEFYQENNPIKLNYLIRQTGSCVPTGVFQTDRLIKSVKAYPGVEATSTQNPIIGKFHIRLKKFTYTLDPPSSIPIVNSCLSFLEIENSAIAFDTWLRSTLL